MKNNDCKCHCHNNYGNNSEMRCKCIQSCEHCNPNYSEKHSFTYEVGRLNSALPCECDMCNKNQMNKQTDLDTQIEDIVCNVFRELGAILVKWE